MTPLPQTPWIGANFWSRVGGPRMWSRYNAAIVREELGVLSHHGCNVTRSFCYWPDFVPEAERLDEDVLARFTDFLDAHVELGLQTIPTFIVGHMSGENWDPAWRDGRDLYRDPGSSRSRRGSRVRSLGASGSTRRSSAGCSPTRCRCTAAGRPWR